MGFVLFLSFFAIQHTYVLLQTELYLPLNLYVEALIR